MESNSFAPSAYADRYTARLVLGGGDVSIQHQQPQRPAIE